MNAHIKYLLKISKSCIAAINIFMIMIVIVVVLLSLQLEDCLNSESGLDDQL
jgi:hypothetical protein